MEESLIKILMEAALKCCGVLSADLFLLMRAKDGKRSYVGRGDLVEKFLSGDLKPNSSDVRVQLSDGNEVSPEIDSSQKNCVRPIKKSEQIKRKRSFNEIEVPPPKVGKVESMPWKKNEANEKKIKISEQNSTASSAVTVTASAKPEHDLDETFSAVLRNLPDNMADANVKSKLHYFFSKNSARIQDIKIYHKAGNHRYGIAICPSHRDVVKVVTLTRNPRMMAKLNFPPNFVAEFVKKIDARDTRATRTLRVTNLRFDVSKNDLRCLFQPFGEIYDLELRHLNTERGNSGQAFVQFSSVEAAVRAREKLMGSKVNGSSLIIGFVKYHPTNSLFLNNFDTGLIQKVMGRFGTLTDVFIKREKRQALLLFQDADCSSKAFAVLARKNSSGVSAQVDYASLELQDDFLGRKKKRRNGDDDDDDPAQRVMLVRVGDGERVPVERAEIPVDVASDVSEDESEFAEIFGRPASTSAPADGPKVIRRSIEPVAVEDDDHPANEEDKSQRLFVGNLDKKTPVSDLLASFSRFGEISNVDMKYQGQDAYCFISFSDPACNEVAMNAMNGATIGEREIVICLD